jgi:copper(I)-binding protein
MFMGLNAPLVEGESFPLTLNFDTAEPVTVEVPIMQITSEMN